MALVKLMQEDKLKFIVSQNLDGLHIKSGIDQDKISELHGNNFTEICATCRRLHMRDYRTRTAKKMTDHRTGALCDTITCRGPLEDSEIDFSEALRPEILEKATLQMGLSDLVICMGSSMRV